MIKYDNELKVFSSESGPRIGTLSIGILTRKRLRDRKGRKRRVRVEYNAPLVGGPGGLAPKTAISNLKKELGEIKDKSIKLSPKNLKLITQAIVKSSDK